ncbi:MAG: uroporphyrinogen decarboxylase [Actinomycetota bacterium]
MRFLEACRRRPTDATPIWMMRQAGRSLPAYRALRERYGFLELIEHPELMAEITLMPLDVMPVDAVVMFADIMLPLSAAGIDFEIVETVGPVIAEPITSLHQLRALERRPILEVVPTVPEAIRLVRKEIDERAPVIGFSGAPFTLASYLIEGRPTRSFTKTKAMLYGQPEVWRALMEMLTDLIIDYLTEQVAAGAQVLQLFDSWIGALTPDDVRAAVLPYSKRIFQALRPYDVPLIHFGTGTAGLLELMAEAGPDVVGLDWRVRLDEAWPRIGQRGVQGNLDPAVLLGPPDLVRARAHDILRRANGKPGHIFNLGHGVLPESPLDNLKLLVDTVHGYEVR